MKRGGPPTRLGEVMRSSPAVFVGRNTELGRNEPMLSAFALVGAFLQAPAPEVCRFLLSEMRCRALGVCKPRQLHRFDRERCGGSR